MPFTAMDLNQTPTTSRQYGLRIGTDGMWFLDSSALAKSFAPMVHTHLCPWVHLWCAPVAHVQVLRAGDMVHLTSLMAPIYNFVSLYTYRRI